MIFPVLYTKKETVNCIAYVEIVFSNEHVDSFKMATTEGQHIEDLQGEEVFGIL